MRAPKAIVRSTSWVLAVLLLFMMVVPAPGLAVPVDLGTTSTYAILAGSTITNTGATTITGDVGLHPGTAFTGQASVTIIDGEVHLADAAALQAKNDLIDAYNDAAGRTPVTIIPTQLGGTTLTPGVYASASGTFQITGTLTLDAQGDPEGVFVFLTDTTLITASGSSVERIGAARPCRVYWKVGSSATLGTDSDFEGSILAFTSITAETGATIRGQLLARNGAVTLDTNTVTNMPCAAPTAGISIVKTPSPTSLPDGPGPVTYTYTVTNAGTLPIADVTVTDDTIPVVTFVSGDSNSDGVLQPTEVWIYTGTMDLTVTTTNVAVVTGDVGGTAVTDTATVTVVVTPTPPSVPETTTPPSVPETTTPPSVPETTTPPSVPTTPTPGTPTTPGAPTTPTSGVPATPGAPATPGTGGLVPTAGTAGETRRTVTGGQLPVTATPWHNLLVLGATLVLIGSVGSWQTLRRSYG